MLESARVAFAALDPLEAASGVALWPASEPAVACRNDEADARTILEDLLARALGRSPCFVSFSGGRDSSAILAVATRVARAYGLEEPIPITFRYSAHPRTHEDDWQQAVISHLRLRRREVLSYDAEADALGPAATDLLRRLGHYWPSGAHVLVPLVRAAAGGSLITGAGGDELFSPWEHRRIALLLARRLRPRPGDLRALAARTLPSPAREALWRRRDSLWLPWLTPAANRELRRRVVADRSRFLRRTWRESAEPYIASRHLELHRRTSAALGHDADVVIVEPFYEPAYIRAVTAAAPPEGYATRAEALAANFADLLPPAMMGRSTKADFTSVFWGPDSRVFAEAWDGKGPDPKLVDLAALRAEWLRPRPDFRSVAPLHAAWLARRTSDVIRTPRAQAAGRLGKSLS